MRGRLREARDEARGLRALDRLLPRQRALPEPAPGDVLLTVPGAQGVYRRRRPDPESFEASWNAADQHLLHARLAPPAPGRERAAALDALLTAWEGRIAPWPPGADAEAVLTWPSRDTELTPVLLGHGLVPKQIAAVREAGRPGPAERRRPAAAVRPLDEADADRAASLWLEELRWEARFGACVPRASAERHVRERLAAALAWVAEADGEVVGLLAVAEPAGADWAAGLTSARRAGYLTLMMVAEELRGRGIGTALARTAHAALDEAGCAVTLLHYAALNPFSAPFWHRHGYRPLWTTWARR
ncbi:GNAT family N-acetyltransferase [Streptomyces hoynatensis]|uniref:GNAT family N-acetyltransferase n=1 Tax=Streptomyces hoynatensis TaxID=1141874 RepID=A0A3A9ZFV6_9ACTN|nr:GNAT family N-acetyltransferase [Streptomyces hoynatensis]RKN47153.1 GNAT family N-acetyltransferase [Streptomyces hoynatensis]